MTKTQHRKKKKKTTQSSKKHRTISVFHELPWRNLWRKRDQMVCTSCLLLRKVPEAIIVTLMLTINWPKPHLISHQTARDYRKCIFSHSAWTLSQSISQHRNLCMKKPEWKYKCCTNCLFHYWLWQSNPNEFDWNRK